MPDQSPATSSNAKASTIPRVSILIPNFNNGRASSATGRDDLIGELLTSLEQTLANDPTPREILAYDDGSTDDSLDTLRQWHERGFIDELIVESHCGVLAKTANVLSQRARGDILVRLDGDIVIHTDNWAEKLVRFFDQGPERLGVVAPKQLTLDGRIHSCGDWLLHPNGYTHIGYAQPADSITDAQEVDHAMGCFYCCRRAVWDDLQGYDEKFLRGQTVDFGFRARLAGWRAFSMPDLVFTHQHGKRGRRDSEADQDTGLEYTLQYWMDKWGFNRLAPDIDAIETKFKGTSVLWNQAVFGPTPDKQYEPLAIADTDWTTFATQENVQKHYNVLMHTIEQVITKLRPIGSVAEVGCGAGLLGHLLAQRRIRYVGMDRNAHAIQLAQQVVKSQTYPDAAGRPDYRPIVDRRELPMDSNTMDMVLLTHALERDRNPSQLLREAGRLLKNDGVLVVLSRRPNCEIAPKAHEHRYHWAQLAGQIGCTGDYVPLLNEDDQQGPDMLVVARRKNRETETGLITTIVTQASTPMATA